MIDLFETQPKPHHTNRMTLEDVQVGVPFYYVRSLGERSRMDKVTPVGEPYESIYTGSLFVECECESSFSSEPYTRAHSLNDAGIIPNTYNNQRCFLDKAAAEEYLARAKTERYDSDHYSDTCV